MVLVTSTDSLYAPPAMLKILKSFFISVDISSAKQCNSSLMYSLKVSPLRIPIFCISLSLYHASDSDFAPPDLNELVSNLSIVIPFEDGYFNAVVENFNAALMLSALRSFLFLPLNILTSIYFYFSPFFVLI